MNVDNAWSMLETWDIVRCVCMVRQLRRYRRARVKARGRCLAILRRAHLRAFPWKNRRRWSVHSHLGLLKRLKLSALHPKTRLELIAVQLKKTRNSEPETEPPDPASVPHSVINHDPDSECPSPTDNNTQIVLRSSLNLSSVSQTCSSGDQGMSLSMTILSPPAPCIVYSNGQPLPDPSHLCNPVAPTIAVTRANQRQRQRKGLKSTMEGVSPLSRRPKRQSRCNIQFWCRAWRKWGHRKWRRARCLLWLSMFKAKRQVRARSRPSSLDTQSQKHTVTVKGSDQQESQRVQERRAAPIRGCGGQGPEDRLATAGSDQTICHLMGTSGLCCTPPQDQCTAKDGVLDITSNATGIKRAVPAAQSKQASVEVSCEAVQKLIYEFLDCFYGKYGSFIPLNKIDVMRHLSKKLNSDLTKRRDFIFTEVAKCQAALARRPMRSFRVVYNKHTLTLDDLFTLDNQNWLNDQVMNMYGELIMESAHHKVHFFNSFFHRQLMTKGYEGVKRWTKKVDLFSKTLLLVPIHLEIHWCLVTADTASRRIHLYDSQGIVFKDAAENILKYIKTEAKEKKQTAFQSGWTVFVHERIPQQTNENDCGVFVLEYCRCLALGKPLHFSQEDMPSVRKRIYKELCDCKLKG